MTRNTASTSPHAVSSAPLRRMMRAGRSVWVAVRRSITTRRMAVPATVVLAAAVIIPIDLVTAAVTGRSTVLANQFLTDQSVIDPYGLHNPSLAPASGRSFVDGADGQVSFDLFTDAGPPTPYPAVAAGQQIEITTELPPTLRVSTGRGLCDPGDTGDARRFVSVACETVEHADGASTIRTTLTAKVALTARVHWRALKSQLLGVVAKDGQTAGAGAGHVMIAYPDDADHVRDRSAGLPFTTAVGMASDLSARAGDVVPDAPSNDPNFTWYTGEQGYLTFETGLGDAGARGVTMKTGESFTYTLDRLVGKDPRQLVLDTAPAGGGVFENACARAVPGYDIRCETSDGVIRLVTTRTGPDIMDDRPVPAALAIPVRHPEGDGASYIVFPRTTLEADMEQLGSASLSTIARQTTLSRQYRPGLGVNGLAVTPYVGQEFGKSASGRVTFGFFPVGAPTNRDALMRTGDEVTMTVNLGTRFNVDTEQSGPEQGDASRNWCDLLDDWNPELDGFLGSPDCQSAMEESTGDIVITVTVTALKDVYQAQLAAGFQIRVKSAPVGEDAVEQISAEISSSREHAVVAPLRRAETTAVRIDDETSSLGVWRAEASTTSGAVGAPPAGSVSWFSDPGVDAPGYWPFAVETGDTLRYRVGLPDGLEVASGGSGAEDVCADPDRYDGFVGSCEIDGRSVEYTLTRTGPSDEWILLRDPFTIPVVHSSPDAVVDGDVEITLDTSIGQSGSANRRAIVPVQTPVPNGYGLHDVTLIPFDGDAFVDHSTGAIAFNLFEGATAPSPAPTVKAGEEFVVTADLPASLEFTDEFGWCDPEGQLQHAFEGYALAVCDVTDHADGSSSLRLSWTARLDLPTAPAFWSHYFTGSHIGVVAREGQIDGTGQARLTITFPDDGGFTRTRIAEPTFTTAVGEAAASSPAPEVPGAPVMPGAPVAPGAPDVGSTADPLHRADQVEAPRA